MNTNSLQPDDTRRDRQHLEAQFGFPLGGENGGLDFDVPNGVLTKFPIHYHHVQNAF
jgi:hypothetical protein